VARNLGRRQGSPRNYRFISVFPRLLYKSNPYIDLYSGRMWDADGHQRSMGKAWKVQV